MPPGHSGTVPDTALVVTLRRVLMTMVMAVALVLVFVESGWLTALGSAAMVLFLGLAWRQFSVGTWVPVILTILALGAALWQQVPVAVLWQAGDRMIFLGALIAMLGTLRSAAAIAPEVQRAGLFVTNQPASHRYLSMTFGGHLFAVLINFGGLALLLDLAQRSMSSEAASQLPEDAREARLKRMSLAVVRGFSMISLWSPFGFATNAILISLPGVSYMQFGPIGFAMSFVFIAVGWCFDRWAGRRFRRMGIPRPSPPPGSWTGAVMLVCHVVALGGLVFLGHVLTPLSFQQALICAVPCYALLWAGATTRKPGRGGPAAGISNAASATWQRLSALGAEVGVFASAGFLPVVLLELIPVDGLRDTIASLGFGPLSLALGLCYLIVVLGMAGVNPIITSSVFGSIASQMAVPGLSDTAIALAIIGGWTGVIGLSPFITTIIICSSIIQRPPLRIGLVWNGPYCMAILAVWTVFLSGLMLGGLI